MKIVSVYYTDKPGGFCKRLYRLLNALAERGHNVVYATLDPEKANLSPKIQKKRIPFPFQKRKGLLFWLLFTLWCPIYVFLLSRRERPERFAVFGSYYAAVASLASRWMSIPTVLFLRSLAFEINRITHTSKLLITLADIIDRYGVTHSWRVICMTEAMGQSLQRFLGKELSSIQYLPNDISVSNLPEKEREKTLPLTVLTAGVIDQRKNLGLLLNAFRILQDDLEKDIELRIAGDGPLREELTADAPANVTFLGWQEDMVATYKACDLVVHPAVHEGMPNVVLEALGYGIPVLASSTPELKELMHYDELLFDPYDHEKLAQRLKKLIRDAVQFDSIRRLSRERAEAFSFDWDERACNSIVGTND